MPRNTRSQSSGRSQASRGNQGAQGGKIDNVLYDIVTVLHEKSKGLEAYDKYEQDLQDHDEIREIFSEIRSNDQEAVQRLREGLRQYLASEEAGSEEEEAA
jgi:type II secretory pathway component PulL